ncbi:MAG TPA: protein kinase [Polyangia bacterium]|nr:protein kinase [Polyangia bacterium]
MDADFNPDGAPERRAAGRGRVASGTVFGGRFQVKQFLGSGGFGERYRAVDAKTERPIDVRILHPGLLGEKGALERLREEIQRAASLQHKNLAATYGMGREGDLHYIATEFVDGQSLRELIDQKSAQQKVFSLKGAYNVIAHVCNGLAYAHQTTFHGALSPSNILVNKAGRVKLTDFGIARTLPALTQFQAQLAAGEFYCMAPELAQAPDTADRRADVYSVGVVLFELLTGRAPTDTFEVPSAVRPDLPRALDNVVEKCLRPSPDERFLSAEELKQALFLAVEQSTIPQASPAKGVALVARRPTGPEHVDATPGPVRPPSTTQPGFATQDVRPGPRIPTARPPSEPMPHFFPPTPAPARNPLPWPTQSAPGFGAPGQHLPREPAYSGPPVDETQEIWLIRKNKLDFGPFTMAEVKRQIMKGDIASEHIIIDSETRQQHHIKDHPYLMRFAADAEIKREERRRFEADRRQARKEKHRAVTLVMIFLILAGAGVAAAFVWLKWQHRGEPVVLVREVPKSDTDLEHILKGLQFEFPKPVIKKRRGSHGGKGGQLAPGDDFDEPTRLGDVTQEGGEEQLSQEQIQSTMNARGRSLAICIAEERRRNPALHQIDLEFIVHGTGQVTAVRVNGQKGTPVASCMLSKMQSIHFPKYNGPKTVAGFSWNIK